MFLLVVLPQSLPLLQLLLGLLVHLCFLFLSVLLTPLLSESRHLRPRVQVTPATPPASFPGDKFPDDPPTLPVRGSKDAPLRDMQHWRAEIFAARGEHRAAIATRFSAIAAKEAAQVALQSATSQEVLASGRVDEAERRFRVAWRNYLDLYGRAASDAESPVDKGKGRASSSDIEEGDSEVVAHELEDESDGEESSVGKMDVS